MYYIGLDVHKKSSDRTLVQTRTQGTGLGDHICAAESGRHGPRSSVVFLNPPRSLGLSVAYGSVMTFAKIATISIRRLYRFAPQTDTLSSRMGRLPFPCPIREG